MRKHVVAGALAAAVATSGALALPAVAQAAVTGHRAAAAYTFTTLDDQADPTFNQLLGSSVHNVIAGYFGSGACLVSRQRAGPLPARQSARQPVGPVNRGGWALLGWSSTAEGGGRFVNRAVRQTAAPAVWPG
jgi:hypothetical protein